MSGSKRRMRNMDGLRLQNMLEDIREEYRRGNYTVELTLKRQERKVFEERRISKNLRKNEKMFGRGINSITKDK